ncbi:hypothetical protein KY304_00180 [Candidatus Woesearchaeota archaeon]|nr:hypothetical protein [Candidatus Woesearchaeota archaeon]MBW2978513.1 hypothetical protein [Candidatus Woesearchaeota archaeon]
MRRGRPVKSRIRQNIIEILAVIGKAYGYQIHKIYNEIYPQCTREVVYYNLRKGVALNEFKIEEIKLEKGEYSWGSTVEKKYYVLGKNAKPKGDAQIKEYFSKQKKHKKSSGKRKK